MLNQKPGSSHVDNPMDAKRKDCFLFRIQTLDPNIFPVHVEDDDILLLLEDIEDPMQSKSGGPDHDSREQNGNKRKKGKRK